MEELSISLKIADAEIKVKTKPEEEAILRKAGKILNEKFKEFQQAYHIDDKAYVMTMIAFGNLVDKLKLDHQLNSGSEKINHELNALNNILDQVK